MLSTFKTHSNKLPFLLIALLTLIIFAACASTPPPEPEPEPEVIIEEEQEPVVVGAMVEMPEPEPEIEVPDMATIQIYYQAKGLNDDARAAIEEYVNDLEAPEALMFTVDGYTCNHGVPHYNMKLSLWRAEAVKAYMIEQGIAPELIDAQGHGPDYPIADNSTQAGRVQNRRVTISAELY